MESTALKSLPVGFLVSFLALISPFLLWPIEQFLPYPHIIEELLKLAVVLLIISYSLTSTSQLKLILVFGGLFALSESVFYMLNIMLVGNLSTLFGRIAFTIPLHILTTLVLWLPTLYKRWFIIGGFGLAVFIHYLYNSSLT